MKAYIKQILRESILTEISSEEAWDKFYSNVEKFPALKGDSSLFNKIEGLYPRKGNQHNRGYFMWIYNLLKNGLKEEDFYKVKEYLEIFGKYINVIPKDKRDINRYKTLQDLFDVIKPFKDAEESGEEVATSKTSEKKQKLDSEVDVVYKSDMWTVKVPKTEWASCELGKGTQWCTAATKSNNMFDRYNSDGPLYVLINNEDNSRYQLHFSSDQLMDVNDRPIPASYFFDHVAEDNGLFEFLKGESDRFYEFILKTSADDMADGGYSETFEEALNSVDSDSADLKETLRTLRYGEDSYSVYLGYVYENDPDNIEPSDVKELLQRSSMDSEDMDRIMQHLREIDFDFESAGLENYSKHFDALESAKLKLNTSYDIDKGRTVYINSVDLDNDEKPYNITLTDKGGKNRKRGNIGFEALKNLIYNRSLFERIIRV